MIYELLATSLLSGFVGTLFGFFLPRYFEVRKEKKTIILDLYKQYSSPEYAVHRRNAYGIFSLHPERTWKEFRQIDLEKSISMDVIMRMYLVIQALVKHKKIDKDLTLELFANNFYEYYYGMFDHAIPKEWEAAKRLDELAGWFAKKLPKDRHAFLKDRFTK